MHPPLLISVAILRLLFLAGLFAEMTGLSLNLKHLISLHKARRLLYASTIRWYNACAVNGSQCARGHAWHAIYPHCSHSFSVIYNACAAMVLGHICPMTEPPTFTGNLHTWALLMVSNMQSRSLMVCVCVCRDVYMTVAVTVALWLSTAVKEDKSQLTSPTCSLPPALLHRGVPTQASLSHPVHLPC